ncbi:MAG: DUF951 domain-containing protein [Firmicutes bacterium]|nr:DUF951 domain-containing protein [Bacillota bacterium]
MELNIGDVVELKKPHPCGGREFEILRAGMDFRIRCRTCRAQIWIPRTKLEKRIKRIANEKNTDNE